jgi:type III secretion system FlhB-like substrate exporter
MSKPKWHEAWQDAFEEGFEDEGEPLTHPNEKKAVSVRRNEDGTTTIVKTATGAEAVKMIAEAEASGLSVESNADQVESLMAEQNGATDVPPEVYHLMSVVIEFAQELCQEWESSKNDSLLEDDSAPQLATEIEYTMDDLRN